MKVAQNGLQLTKASEGLRLIAYDDHQPNLNLTNNTTIKGTLTIGYGHTGKDVFIGKKISQDEATSLLIKDLEWAEDVVLKNVKVPITQNMFDSLVDFVYNIGSGNFLGSKTYNKPISQVLAKLNKGDYQGSADSFMSWTTSKGVSQPGLVNRCKSRRELFLTGIGNLTYYALDRKTLKPDNSSGVLKFIAGFSILASLS